jgi:hypothetical protein
MERQASRMDVVFQMVYYNPMSTKCIKVSSFVFSGLFGFEIVVVCGNFTIGKSTVSR